MSIISQKTFDKFTEKEKKSIQIDYQDLLSDNGRWIDSFTIEERNGAITQLEWMFDKENLQPEPESKIKTWEDVEKANPTHFSHSNAPNPMLIPSQELRDKLLNKSIAMYKIATLIGLGYGGMITDEEWRDYRIHKYCVVLDMCGKLSVECRKGNSHEFIAFHTKQQAEEFMSYIDNKTLVEQYYMI